MDKEKENIINQDEERNSRRRFLKIAGLAAGVTAVAATAVTLPGPLRKTVQDSTEAPFVAAAPVKPKKLTPFVDPLIIPPLAEAVSSTTTLDYYEIPIVQATTHKFHSSLPATTTQSYFASAPAPGFWYLGPTIVAQKDKPVRIKVTNNLPPGLHQLNGAMDYTIMGNTNDRALGNPKWDHEHRTCVHLHGGKVNVDSDGGPRDWFSTTQGTGLTQVNPYEEAVDFPKDGTHTYNYPNDQDAAMLWYHDHAWGITRFNPFLGQAGAYIVRDTGENDLIAGTDPLQKIPSGIYEVPIVLQDRLLDLVTGAMIYPVAPVPGSVHNLWIPEYFGDTPIVNGRAYPFHEVEPRRYRFRFINGSQARFYNIWLNDAVVGPLPMWVIGSEQGFLPAPAMVTKLVIAPGERFDIIVDFAGRELSTITLKNNAKAPYPGGRGGEIPQIMQFRVVKPLTGTDTTTLPGSLILPTIDPPLTPNPLTQPWREVVLSEIMDPLTGGPLEALLDGVPFTYSAPPRPPLFTEDNGATNVWQFINTTGDAHPMHLHLVKFKIVNRQPFDSIAFLAAWDAWNLAGRLPAGPGVPGRPSVNAFLKGALIPPAPEETGWKDTAKANPGEVLRIIAKFDLPGDAPTGTNIYVCHCHILEHEENDMMFYFGVNNPPV